MQQRGLILITSALFFSISGALVGMAEGFGGKIVYYSERGANAELFVMNANGTDSVRLTTNSSNEFCPHWSPDGTRIAFESDRDDPHPVSCFPNCAFRIYVMNADGTGERRLTNLDGLEGHADWSPDGQSIAFHADRNADGKNEIYVAPVDGGETRLVLGDAFDNTAPDWSPDGMSIAFSSDRDGGMDIYVVGVDGTGLRKIVDTGIADYFPDWSPDGTQILFFAANWPTVKQTIYVVGVDGSNLRALTTASSVVNESAQWSPDGETIVFQSNRDGNFEIYSMKSDGSDVVRLTRQSGGDYWPDLWLAVGSDEPTAADAVEEASALGAAQRHPIAFVSTRAGRAQIYAMNADGSDPVRLTNEPYDDYYPAWSPDGSQIAYYVHLSWQSWALVVMNADGSGRRQITEGAGCVTCAMAPYWSPDGTQIGFTIEPDPRPTCETKSTELGIINADGTGCRWVTTTPWSEMFSGWSRDGAWILFTSTEGGSEQVCVMSSDYANARRLTDGPSTSNMPAWSPDGTRIAFVSDRDGNSEIYVMATDGSDVTRITFDPAHDALPCWSPDGMEIVFSSDSGGRTLDIYAVALDGSGIRRLTSGPGYNYEATWRP
jgi:Tol biopolymer transport system component